jgi:hypothetical protein
MQKYCQFRKPFGNSVPNAGNFDSMKKRIDMKVWCQNDPMMGIDVAEA